MKRKVEVLLADTESLKSKVFDLRREVFVVEQHVRHEDEFDEHFCFEGRSI